MKNGDEDGTKPTVGNKCSLLRHHLDYLASATTRRIKLDSKETTHFLPSYLRREARRIWARPVTGTQQRKFQTPLYLTFLSGTFSEHLRGHSILRSLSHCVRTFHRDDIHVRNYRNHRRGRSIGFWCITSGKSALYSLSIRVRKHVRVVTVGIQESVSRTGHWTNFIRGFRHVLAELCRFVAAPRCFVLYEYGKI